MRASKNTSSCISLIVLMALLMFMVGCWGTPESVEKAKKELELLYIKQDIYTAVDVESAKVDGEYYIFCSAAVSNSEYGGLFWIDQNESSDSYTIYTANGKAKQHAGFKYEKMDDIRDTTKIMDQF